MTISLFFVNDTSPWYLCIPILVDQVWLVEIERNFRGGHLHLQTLRRILVHERLEPRRDLSSSVLIHPRVRLEPARFDVISLLSGR